MQILSILDPGGSAEQALEPGAAVMLEVLIGAARRGRR